MYIDRQKIYKLQSDLARRFGIPINNIRMFSDDYSRCRFEISADQYNCNYILRELMNDDNFEYVHLHKRTNFNKFNNRTFNMGVEEYTISGYAIKDYNF